MSLVRRPYAYSKVDKEDPDEVFHRRAQFLIYRALEKADSRRRTSILRIRLRRLKVRIGKRLRKLGKSMLASIYAARVAFHKQLKMLMRLVSHGETIATLPPLFP